MNYQHGECVVFTPELEVFGGAERTCIALLEGLHEHGIPSRYVCYEDRMGLAKYAAHPIQITELRPKMQPIHKIRALREYFAGRSADDPQPLMSGIQAAIHAGAAGLKGFHVLMHDTPSLVGQDRSVQSKKDVLRAKVSHYFLRKGLGSGGRTIVSSTYLRDESQALFGGDVVMAPMGGKKKQSLSSPHIVRDELRLLSVSRLEPNKRIDWILRALADVRADLASGLNHTRWSLDVVGSGGQLASLQKLAKELGIGPYIRFHGFVTNEMLEQIFAECHLFLMPARQGYGLPALEALDRGMPVLVHRESGVSDLLLDTPWAVVFSGGVEDLTRALNTAVDRVLRGVHVAAPLPAHPSEQDWAEQVARYCHWIC